MTVFKYIDSRGKGRFIGGGWLSFLVFLAAIALAFGTGYLFGRRSVVNEKFLQKRGYRTVKHRAKIIKGPRSFKEKHTSPNKRDKKAANDKVGALLAKEMAKDDADSFWLQVSSLRREDRASALAKRLTLKGYPVEIISITDNKGRRWYRVRVGPYDTKKKAYEVKEDVAACCKLDGMVVKGSENGEGREGK